MNTPKLTQRKRDGIWEVSYYHNNKRIRKSLGTKIRIEAGIRFTQLTGCAVPIEPERTTPSTLYVDAVNEFIEAKWEIKIVESRI